MKFGTKHFFFLVNTVQLKKPKNKELVKWGAKILISAVALFFVFRIIDPRSIFNAFFSANPFYLFLAFVFFNLSKIVSSFRLNCFYRAVSVNLSEKYNLYLYYIGMFYNLFLPGSVGGDAYKVLLLKQEKKGSAKSIFKATLLDRLSGLVALSLLTFVLILCKANFPLIPHLRYFAIAGLLLTIPAYTILVRYVFKDFTKVLWPTLHLSLWVQLGQLLCAYFILKSLEIHSEHLDYLILFMVSSVVAVFPFTIGGIGAREMVFLYGYNYLLLDQKLAIAFTFLFFSILATSSFVGLVFSLIPSPHSTKISSDYLPEK